MSRYVRTLNVLVSFNGWAKTASSGALWRRSWLPIIIVRELPHTLIQSARSRQPVALLWMGIQVFQALVAEIRIVQFRIVAALRQKRLVIASLNNRAFLQHDDAVRRAHCG